MAKNLVKVEDFNGHPIISLLRNKDDEHPFRFGVKKAQLIVANKKEIETFVADYEAQTE